jgi:hypothetical protein
MKWHQQSKWRAINENGVISWRNENNVNESVIWREMKIMSA